eukprot:8639768-Prorocentrum_lima.AAC.1
MAHPEEVKHAQQVRDLVRPMDHNRYRSRRTHRGSSQVEGLLQQLDFSSGRKVKLRLRQPPRVDLLLVKTVHPMLPTGQSSDPSGHRSLRDQSA